MQKWTWFCCVKNLKKWNHDSVVQKCTTKFWLCYVYKYGKKKKNLPLWEWKRGKEEKNEWMNVEKERGKGKILNDYILTTMSFFYQKKSLSLESMCAKELILFVQQKNRG